MASNNSQELFVESFVPKYAMIVRTHDMHTGGEPVRIVLSGFPTLVGSSVLQKIQDMKKNHDHYRKLIMNEPRGHKDMYGAILIRNEHLENNFDVIFMHNEGYSSMCGHAVIALGRFVVDCGFVKSNSPETVVIFNCPCGPVQTYIQLTNDLVSDVRFHSVPAFVYKSGIQVTVPNIGNISVDIAFGGAFYVIVEDRKINLNLETSPLTTLVAVASNITDKVKKEINFHHPDSEDLAFLYGTIITDGKDKYEEGSTRNLCVFADKEVDRSPTGSGVTARIALQVHKGLIRLNQEKEFKSIVNTTFKGKAVSKTKFGEYDAVIVEVSGMAYHTGRHTFYLEESDPLSEGFQLTR